MTVVTRSLGRLTFEPAAGRPDLLAPPVAAAATADAWVAPIDAELADTAAFCEAYDIPPAQSANCVIVAGRRDGVEKVAAVIVLATTRADVNGVVRKKLDVRKASFAAQDDAVRDTAMEYGGITPIGLPDDWPVWIDSRVAEAGPVIIGAGIRGAKILIDGADLAKLPGAEIVPDLARPIS